MPSSVFNSGFMANFCGLRFYQLTQAPAYPHCIFAIVVPILINIVNLKYPNQSVFEAHPKTVYFGVLVLLLYFLAFDAQQRLEMGLAEFVLIHRFLVFLGYMEVAALASIIFPGPASPALYAVYIAISVGDIAVSVCRKVGGWLVTRNRRSQSSELV